VYQITLTGPLVLFSNFTSTTWFDGEDLWGPQPANTGVDKIAKYIAADNAHPNFMIAPFFEFGFAKHIGFHQSRKLNAI
jgi:hypothetical protein